jgi:hypothetical protein
MLKAAKQRCAGDWRSSREEQEDIPGCLTVAWLRCRPWQDIYIVHASGGCYGDMGAAFHAKDGVDIAVSVAARGSNAVGQHPSGRADRQHAAPVPLTGSNDPVRDQRSSENRRNPTSSPSLHQKSGIPSMSGLESAMGP